MLNRFVHKLSGAEIDQNDIIKQTVALAAAYGMNVTTPQADAIEAFGEIDA